MTILLGLLSALFYGSTDFVARFAARGVGVVRTILWAQWSAAALLSLGLATSGVPAASPTSWGLLVGSDVVILGSTAFLYHALAVGRFSIVAPIAASYGGFAALFSALSGESLPTLRWVGLVVLSVRCRRYGPIMYSAR